MSNINIDIDINIMRKNARIVKKNNDKFDCFIDEVIEGDSSDRHGIPFMFIKSKGEMSVIYADEIKSIEILEEE